MTLEDNLKKLGWSSELIKETKKIAEKVAHGALSEDSVIEEKSGSGKPIYSKEIHLSFEQIRDFNKFKY